MGGRTIVTSELTFGEFERSGWEEVAETGYEDVARATTAQAIEPLLDAISAEAGMVVLDVPTGPGLLLVAGCSRGATMIGVDVAEGMLRVAARNCPEADLRLGAAEVLPVDDGAVDGIVSAYGMPHFVDHTRFFAEAHRTLRRSGRLAFATWCPPPTNQHIALVMSTLMRLGNLDVGLPPGPDIFRYADPDICKQELVAAGFSDVQLEELPTEWRSPEGADGLIKMVEQGGVRSRKLYQAQTDEVKRAVRAALAEGLEPFRGVDGVFRVPATSVLVTATRP